MATPADPTLTATPETGDIHSALDDALKGLDIGTLLDEPTAISLEPEEDDDTPEPVVTPEAKAAKDAADAAAAKTVADAAAAEALKAGEAGDEVPKGLDEKATTSWKQIKLEAKEAKAEVARITAELVAAKAASANPAELTTLRAELEATKKTLSESEGELGLTRVQGTQEFKNAITVPKANILDLAGKFATKYDVSKEQLVAALSEPDQSKQGDMLAAIGATFQERDRMRLYGMGDDFLELSEREALLLKDSAATMDRIQARRKGESETVDTAQRNEYGAALSEVEGELSGKGLFFKTEGEGVDPEHGKAVKAAFEVARSVNLTSLNPKGRAYAAYAGAVFPLVMGNLAAANAEVTRLTAELAKINKADPGAGGGGGDAGDLGGDSGDDESGDANDAFEKASRALAAR